MEIPKPGSLEGIVEEWLPLREGGAGPRESLDADASIITVYSADGELSCQSTFQGSLMDRVRGGLSFCLTFSV